MLMKDEVAKKINNNQILRDYFGYWPTFHDGAIEYIELNGTNIDYIDLTKITVTKDSVLRLKIYTFNFEPSSDKKGTYSINKECVVTLVFRGVNELIFDISGSEDAAESLLRQIFEVEFRIENQNFIVDVNGIVSNFSFSCGSVEVDKIEMKK